MKATDSTHVFPKDPRKTYGLMELVKGTTSTVDKGPENAVFTWPHVLIREVLLCVGVVALLLIAAVVFNAPLEEPANPAHPPNPAKAPWYLVGIQEMVSYSALIGGIVVPGLIVAFLMLIPFIDRKKVGIGIWFAKERLWPNILFMTFLIVMLVFIIIGAWFRGENWSFVTPW